MFIKGQYNEFSANNEHIFIDVKIMVNIQSKINKLQ